MRVVAVPVKSLAASKGRLAGVLTDAERAALTLAMLGDVLDAALAQAGWDTWVISRDRRVLRKASGAGAKPLEETGFSLGAAVRQVELGVPEGALAVVLGDLPWLDSAQLGAALERAGSVVAAPAASDGGTNLLLRRPPSVIPARFGRASFARHAAEAARAGVEFVEVRTPGLQRDVDRPKDLAALVSDANRSRARAVCLEMRVAERLVRPAPA